MEKSKKNAASVIFHPLWLPILGDIWKCIVEKSQIDATDVTLSLLGPTILEELAIQNFWKKSRDFVSTSRGGVNESQVFVTFSKNEICIRNVHKCDETNDV